MTEKPCRPDPDPNGRVFWCTCGAFCGTDSLGWLAHINDRKTLNPEATFNPKTLGVLDRVAEAYNAMARMLSEALYGKSVPVPERNDQ